MNKVLYIPAPFKAVGKNVTKKVPTGEKKKGLFGGEKDVTETVTEWVQTGFSDSEIDGEALSKNISEAVSVLNSDGYKVVLITPITSGKYDYKWKVDTFIGAGEGGYAYGYGYGYSYTEGVTIIGEKIA
ncbi:hypothetical protein [Shewanella seohaensis]|uniref:Uncharacterized protein n=1 Tax=Shewanella seohaensis TaxID=755175 RepID=A0ABV4VU37_9GAMM